MGLVRTLIETQKLPSDDLAVYGYAAVDDPDDLVKYQELNSNKEESVLDIFQPSTAEIREFVLVECELKPSL